MGSSIAEVDAFGVNWKSVANVIFLNTSLTIECLLNFGLFCLSVSMPLLFCTARLVAIL
jgi:hypothetical protein